MTSLKKITAVLLAVLLIGALCVPAFAAEVTLGEGTEVAGEGEAVVPGENEEPAEPEEPEEPAEPVYDWKANDSVVMKSSISDNHNYGNFVLGGYSPACFNVTEKKMYTLAEGLEKGFLQPVTFKEVGMQSTSGNFQLETARVCAYYCFNCPVCGQAIGGTSYYNIYSRYDGLCGACQKALPDPATLTIYRAIIIDIGNKSFNLADPATTCVIEGSEPSLYYALDGCNLTKYSDSVYGETESLYGDGKDLPEGFLDLSKETLRDENGNKIEVSKKEVYYYNLNSFKTKGIAIDDFMAWLFFVIIKLQMFNQNIITSSFNTALYKFNVSLTTYTGIGKIFASPLVLFNELLSLILKKVL